MESPRKGVRVEMVLSLAFALWGLAVAIAMITVWERPAPPDQIPGLATAQGFDAHGPFRWMAGLMLLPVLVPFALRPVARRLAQMRSWARHSVVAAILTTFWIVTTFRHVGWAIVPCAIVVILCTLLGNRDLRFTRADFVLILVFLETWLALIDIGFHSVNAGVLLAALIVFAIRVAVTFIPSPVPPALSFVLAPLGLLLQTSFLARDQRYYGWHVLVIAVLTPFLLRMFARSELRLRKQLVFAIYPLALYAYANSVSLHTAEGKPRVNFFEDGHALLPASEYLSGERPYRDVLPAHGLVDDGGFDWLAMKSLGADAGTRWKAKLVAGNLAAVALYALAFAMTGSAEGALLAVLLSLMTDSYTMQLRLALPLAMLALLAAAVRLRRPRLFAWAAFASVLCGLTSLDFGFYTFATLVVALLRTRTMVSLKAAAAGILAGVIPLTIGLASFGILDDFLRGTFVETLAVGPAYTLEFFTVPYAVRSANAVPDALVALLDRTVFPYVYWAVMALFAGAMVLRRAGRRLEPFILVAVWTVFTGISYAERHHLYFKFAAGAVIVFVILRLLRRRSVLAPVMVAAAIVLAAPTSHMGVVGWMRHSRGPVEPGWVQVKDVPRARGAYFHESDSRVIASVHKYVTQSLRPDETFFDFTNSGILYFLMERDCPIREYEVAFYETEELQREVIRRIDSNPKVRAALVPATPQGRFSVDGIPNATRAPLVWQYLESHFEPHFQEGEVVFWRRR